MYYEKSRPGARRRDRGRNFVLLVETLRSCSHDLRSYGLSNTRMIRCIFTCIAAFGFCAGVCLPVSAQTSNGGESDPQTKSTEPMVSCHCKVPVPHGHSQPVHKPAPDNPCDAERQKAECAFKIAQEQAKREAELGRYYVAQGQFDAAFNVCEAALQHDGSLPAARECHEWAIHGLQRERQEKFYERLKLVDARIRHAEPDEALLELERTQAELAPDHSPLGGFDKDMNQSVVDRFDWATRAKRLIRSLAALPSLLWNLVKIFGVIAAGILLIRLIILAWRFYKRHKKYSIRGPDSETVEWTVWSILDVDDRGGSGPVMDALNPASNPLLKEPLRPSSLLLVPPLPAINGTNGGDDHEPAAWRDFLDEPRAAIDMEKLPSLSDFQKHRFNQVEAFDEFDIKVGSVEAKGIVGLLRTLRKWLDSGLPAAQGTVYTLKGEGPDKQTYACVRITCNWTVEKQVSSEPSTAPTDADRKNGHEHSNVADETLSVYASSAHDASIDAVALSAQRAAFKLFHRLLKRSTPTYATAVANFHQGVRLIDEYI
jgi:hypothetical protein